MSGARLTEDQLREMWRSSLAQPPRSQKSSSAQSYPRYRVTDGHPALDLFDEGFGVDAVMARLGLSKPTVQEYFREWAVNKDRSKYTAEQMAAFRSEIHKLRGQYASYRTIAHELGLSQYFVRWLHRT